ncbi:MAG TPA: DUF4129 domain-containing protein [Acidobacteriaceae bacterium]|nr:DUF4129 domain-containing protein [Acidobacteriaceae bacterium]
MWRGVAVAGVTLGLTLAAHAAGLRDVSVDGFRAEVVRLQGVVAACGRSAAGCNADAVGDDVRVGDVAKGGFEEHWDWLRGALKEARTAKDGERAKAMGEAGARLEEMGRESAAGGAAETGFAHERDVANAVLAQPQFQGAVGLTWWDRAKTKMLGWLQRMFEGVVRVRTAAPWLGTLLEWVFYVGAAVGLLFFLLRNAARQRLRVALGGEAVQKSAWESEAEDWAKAAAEHAEAGEWREAVHCLYWAAIVLLESRRAWRHNPTRTPREYVRLLKPGSAQQQGLRRLTQIFERVWYGLRDADESEYAEARTLYQRLAAGAAESVGATNETLAAGGVA